MYLDGRMTWMEVWGEEGGYLVLRFFSIIYILGLVCYKHTIHELQDIVPAYLAFTMATLRDV